MAVLVLCRNWMCQHVGYTLQAQESLRNPFAWSILMFYASCEFCERIDAEIDVCYSYEFRMSSL